MHSEHFSLIIARKSEANTSEVYKEIKQIVSCNFTGIVILLELCTISYHKPSPNGLVNRWMTVYPCSHKHVGTHREGVETCLKRDILGIIGN